MRRRSEPDRDHEDEAPSKTQVKKAMLELQDLGLALSEMPAEQFAAIDLDDRLRDAVQDLRRLTAHGARKRQTQYVGKLLRAIDVAPIRTAIAAHRRGRTQDAQILHEVERWRERLLADDDALDTLLSSHPTADTAAFRALLRNACRERAQTRDNGQAARGQSRHYRELFRSLRAILQPGTSTSAAESD